MVSASGMLKSVLRTTRGRKFRSLTRSRLLRLVPADGKHVESCAVVPIDDQRVLIRFGSSEGSGRHGPSLGVDGGEEDCRVGSGTARRSAAVSQRVAMQDVPVDGEATESHQVREPKRDLIEVSRLRWKAGAPSLGCEQVRQMRRRLRQRQARLPCDPLPRSAPLRPAVCRECGRLLAADEG
jgi:hypothetical protein